MSIDQIPDFSDLPELFKMSLKSSLIVHLSELLAWRCIVRILRSIGKCFASGSHVKLIGGILKGEKNQQYALFDKSNTDA